MGNNEIAGKMEPIYSLSVIIPIHKSCLKIERCLDSLLSNKRLDLQILVAANSDSKRELEKINRKIQNRYSGIRSITLLNIRKRGKANAINSALPYVKNEIVLIGDADTYFYCRGLTKCVSRIQKNKNIVAISGNVDVFGRNILSGIQQFEYCRIFHIFRPFWNYFNANLIISGCAGIFRTKCLFEVGLYDTHTLGEDFEITLRLHDYYIRHNPWYRIEYLNTKLAKTDVPVTFSSFVRQRKRWFLGFMEVTAKYRKILLHPINHCHIIIPYLLSVLFEKWTSILKWIFLAVSIGLCTYNDEFFLKGVLVSFFSFGMFEILFNNIITDKLIPLNEKCSKTMVVTFFTFCLMGLQFVINFINPIQYLLAANKKENRWY